MSLTNFTSLTQDMYDKRFGMFVHWGLYSQLGGMWNGEKLPEGMQDGAWNMLYNQIPLEEYKKAAYDFKPDTDWAQKLVLAAKNAGMKYIVFTTKHHEGFSMFETSATDYNSVAMCGGRDFVRELSEACKRHGLKLGLYYSHCLDWAEKNGGGKRVLNQLEPAGDNAKNNNHWDFPEPLTQEAFTDYLQTKVKTQVKELLTNYGEIYLIWFDYPHDISPTQSKELYDYVKSIQPNCMVNSRISHGVGDYSSLGDNAIPTTPLGMPAECLATLNDTWGYISYDDNWKSPEYTTELLARCITGGTTLLMNVGPMPDGNIPEESLKILSFMGEWIDKYSDAVYGMKSNPLKTKVTWGHIGCKGNSVYVYISDRTKKEYVLGGLESKVKKVIAPDSTELEFVQTEDELTFRFEDKYGFLPVIVIECDKEITPINTITQCGDSLNLFPLYGKKRCENGQYEPLRIEYDIYHPEITKHGLALNRNCIIHAWNDTEEWLEWNATIKQSGTYNAVLTTALCDYNGDISVEVLKDGISVAQISAEFKEQHRYNLSKTGSDNIRIVASIGSVEIPEPGEYEFALKKSSDKDLPVSHLTFEK